MMMVAKRIEEILNGALKIEHMELHNESHMHAGPATESHFKLVLVSSEFTGLNRVKRHQRIYGLLKEEMQAGGSGSIHALALHLFTPMEWQQSKVPESPLCAGKNL